MNRKEEQEIERKVKKENKTNADAEKLYAGITNGIPNEKNQGDNFDAVNANLVNGGMGGSHETNINTQTNLELGGLVDPGGLDPAMDRQFLKNMKKNLKKNE